MPASLFANDPAVFGAVSDRVIPDSLETEVRRIYARSPLYARRFPLHAAPLKWSCFQEIPTLAKRDIVEQGHQAFFEDYRVIERGLADKSYEYESTSGTTSAGSALPSALPIGFASVAATVASARCGAARTRACCASFARRSAPASAARTRTWTLRP
jgi:hypothetical protein